MAWNGDLNLIPSGGSNGSSKYVSSGYRADWGIYDILRIIDAGFQGFPTNWSGYDYLNPGLPI